MGANVPSAISMVTVSLPSTAFASAKASAKESPSVTTIVVTSFSLISSVGRAFSASSSPTFSAGVSSAQAVPSSSFVSTVVVLVPVSLVP